MVPSSDGRPNWEPSLSARVGDGESGLAFGGMLPVAASHLVFVCKRINVAIRQVVVGAEEIRIRWAKRCLFIG